MSKCPNCGVELSGPILRCKKGMSRNEKIAGFVMGGFLASFFTFLFLSHCYVILGHFGCV